MPEFLARVKDPDRFYCFRPGGWDKSRDCREIGEFLKTRLLERVEVQCLPLLDDGLFRVYITYPTGEDRVVDLYHEDTIVISPYGKLWVYPQKQFKESFETG